MERDLCEARSIAETHCVEDNMPIAMWIEENVRMMESKYGKDATLECPNEKELSRKMIMCCAPNLTLTTLPMASCSDDDGKALILSNTKYLKHVDVLHSEGSHWESTTTSAAKKTEITVKFREQVDETMN